MRVPGNSSALRQLRTDRGLTQEAVADRARLNTRHYQKLEEGSVNVTLQTLERLGSALNVQGHELLVP